MRRFWSLFLPTYVAKWGWRHPDRRWEWRSIIAVDLLGDFSRRQINGPVAKLLIFPSFSSKFRQVWLQFVYRFCIVFTNAREIANFTFCGKENKKKHFSFSLFSLGSLGFDAELFPLHKPGLICLTCCSERFPRLVPALSWGTWWSQTSGILIHRF